MDKFKALFNLITQYLSIDERKTSSVMLVFLLYSAIGAWKFFKYNLIDPQSVYLIIALASLILGVNTYNTYLNNKNNGGSGSV